MRYFRIDKDTYTENLGGCDADDEWSRDSTYENHSLNGLVEVSESDYHDVVIADGDGESFFLVYGLYDTGDSFGTDEGQFEEVSLHRDNAIALENVKRLEKHERENDVNCGDIEYNVELLNDDGSTFTYRPPWLGYFERLRTVEVDKLDVLEKRMKRKKRGKR